MKRLSINTLKLRVALSETGTEYTYIPVDLAAGEQRQPAFLALNPHGKIPVLVDGDFVLAESNAILWYIAERFPAAGLLGPSPRERAAALQWCDFASTALYPGYFDVYVHAVVNPPEKRIHAMADAGREKLKRAYAALERVLATRQTLTATYSIGDIAVATVLRVIQDRLPYEPALYPHTRAWYQRTTERPAWQEAIAPGTK